MKITKYEHSCIEVKEGNNRLIIDPGIFSKSLNDFSNIDAVVITHEHQDHFDPVKIQSIIKANPSVQIITTSQVAKALNSKNAKTARLEEEYSIGKLKLEFFGEKHELFTDVENIAVLVNEKFYHPGDSYTLPDVQVEILSAPASAPWLRITEASKFISDIGPKIAFPSHNALLSEIGESIHYRILSNATKAAKIDWKVLKPGESIII